MKAGHRRQLLLTSILFFMVAVSALSTSLGSWDWYGSGYHKLTPEIEEYMWYMDAYYFLHSDDNEYFYSNTARYWLDDANRLYLVGSYEKAAESYARAVNLDPSLLEGWLNLGNSLYFLGRYQASLNAYNAILRLEPQNVNALAGKSQVLLALDKSIETNNSSMAPTTLQ